MRILLIGLCALSLLFLNSPALAIQAVTRISAGGNVELYFKVTCQNTYFDYNVSALKVDSVEGVGGQEVSLYHDEGGLLGVGSSRVKVGDISQISSSRRGDEGEGALAFSIKDLSEGTYYVGVWGAGKRGLEFKATEAITVRGDHSGGYSPKDGSVHEYKFNLGDCEAVKKQLGIPDTTPKEDKPAAPQDDLSVLRFGDASLFKQPNEKTIPVKVTCGEGDGKKLVPGATVNVTYGVSGARYGDFKNLTTITDSNGIGSLSVIEQDVQSQTQEIRGRYRGGAAIDINVGSILVGSNWYTATQKIADLNVYGDLQFQDTDSGIELNNSICPVTSDQSLNTVSTLKDNFQKDIALKACNGQSEEWKILSANYSPSSELIVNRCLFVSINCFNDEVEMAEKQGKVAEAVRTCIGRGLDQSSQSEIVPANSSQPSPDGSANSVQPVIVQTPTGIEAFIHGKNTSGEEIWGIDTGGGGRVAVAARVTPEGSPECIIDAVDLKWAKVGENGTEIPLAVSYDREEGGRDNVYLNCQPYWAPLKGDGTYKLTASYRPAGENEKVYQAPNNSAVVEITINGIHGSIPTESSLGIQTQIGARIKSSNVAGVEARRQGDKIIISQNKNSFDKLIFTPKTTINGSLDTDQIPTNNFAVIEVFNDGGTEELINSANFPNGQQYSISEEALDFSRLNHLKAITSYNNPESKYASSQDEVEIGIANTQVEAKPYVLLSSDPAAGNISASDAMTVITITAFTNQAVENPVFEVVRNDQLEGAPVVVSSSTNCQDTNGSCQYIHVTEIILQQNSSYSVNFKDRGISAKEPLTFSTKSQSTNGEIKNIELSYQGNTRQLPVDESQQISQELEVGENVFKRVIYRNGEPVTQSFTVIYEPEGSPVPTAFASPMPSGSLEPSPTAWSSAEPTSSPVPINRTVKGWYCVGNQMYRSYQDGVAEFDCTCGDGSPDCGSGTTCINREDVPAGYEFDAKCITPLYSPAPEQSEVPASNPELESTVPQSEGAAGDPCIYSNEDGNCYDGTIKAQSSCGGKTPSGICINPSGGCQYGGHQVDCSSGDQI